MRFLMHVSMPIEPFNSYVRDGSAGQRIGKVLEEIKPEAAYFTSVDGHRGGYVIVNMDNASEIPRLAEPFFLIFNAEVEFSPCMTPADLQAAGLDTIGKKWK